jgi:hypothetical protein
LNLGLLECKTGVLSTRPWCSVKREFRVPCMCTSEHVGVQTELETSADLKVKLSGGLLLLAGPRTKIQFICNVSAANTSPKFVNCSGKTYLFEVETPLACKAWPQECVVGCLTVPLCGGMFH